MDADTTTAAPLAEAITAAAADRAVRRPAEENSEERILASLARSFVGAALEVIEGRRMLRQLEGMTTARVLEKIAARAALREHSVAARPAVGAPSAHLGRTLVCETGENSWEIVVLCTEARRTRACALRIVRRRNRWIIDDLEMG